MRRLSFNLKMKSFLVYPHKMLSWLMGIGLFLCSPSLQAEFQLFEKSVEEEIGLVEPKGPSKEFPASDKIFHFDQKSWNEARESVEEKKEEEKAAGVETPPSEVPPVEDPGIAIALPYESGLSISGRKLISVKLEETRRKSSQNADGSDVQKVQRDFEMEQELQVRIKGKVGRKISVNVDFDDTKDDKRDISVVYEGDPEEVVQEAAFGDITLSLPSTEFVSYSKQLFGVRTRLKYKDAQFMAIGSRTKGITETKRFNGNSKFERKEILDTSYVKKRYYDLNFTTRSIVVGSEEIWRDDRDTTNDNPPLTQTFTAEDFAINSSSFTGTFDKLKPSEDYTIDYSRGIIQFTSPVQNNAILIVDYTLDDGRQLSLIGTPGQLKILKTENDLPLVNTAETGYQREIKTYYTIGRKQIIRDNGRENFILRIIDKNRNDIDVQLTNGAFLKYPDNIEVDFENGVFNITPPESVNNPALYNSAPTHEFSFLLEYQYRVRTYLVKPNIVLGSERVTLSGRLLARDLDYFIDYDTGFLTFFNEDDIDETSQIEVTYEFTPFGGQLGQTLVGTRTELPLGNNFFVGSTLLYTFAPKPTVVPDIRSTPSSLLVLEADSRVMDFQLPILPLTMSLEGEVAQSQENPNLFGKALVDSMEGVKREDQAVMDEDFWQVGSNPTGAGVPRPDALFQSLSDEEFLITDINPHAGTDDGDKQRVLTFNYNLANKPGTVGVPEQTSIVHSLSQSGRDFSKKEFFEMWIQGAGANGQGVDIIVDAGQFNEDADGDGVLDTEDFNNDGTLNEGEDVGWIFNDPGPNAFRGDGDDRLFTIDPENGRLNTEDLDRDGTSDFSDLTLRPGVPIFQLSRDSGVGEMINPSSRVNEPVSDLNFTGWRFIRIPLNILSSEIEDFQAVKQIRVTLINTPSAAPRTGTFRVGKISFTGNLWEPPVAVVGSTMTLTAVNNIDNPEYRSLLGNGSFNDLYDDDSSRRTREQALALKYTLQSGSSATTRVNYATPRDFSSHKSLNFFLQTPAGKPTGATFFLQIGSKDAFFEYAVPLTVAGVWQRKSISLVDLNNDGIPDKLEPKDPAATLRIVGSPKMTDIGQIKMGIRHDGAGTLDSELWVNEIHLSGSRRKVGNAYRVSADFDLKGWGTFGGTVRNVDRNFQTLTSQVLNQDRDERTGYFTIDRFSRYLPLSGNITKSETRTPAALRTGEAGLVSVLSEGRELSVQGRTVGQLLIPKFPGLGFSYDKSLTKSTSRQETRDRDTYTGSFDYSFQRKPDILPGKKLTFRPLPQTVFVKYLRSNHFLTFFPERKTDVLLSSATTIERRNAIFANVRTREFTDHWSGDMNFSPWSGFTFKPDYSWKKVREKRDFTADDLLEAPDFSQSLSYDKSLSQKQGVSMSLRLFHWLNPTFVYEMEGTETNFLPQVSSPTAFDQKTITRTSNGNASWNLAMKQLFPNFSPVRSLNINNSFRVESGDSYENVEKEFKDWQKVGVFQVKKLGNRKNGKALYSLLNDLNPKNPNARRKQLTLRNTYNSRATWSPLDWIKASNFLRALKTVNLTASYTNADEHEETTSTEKDTLTVAWPDVVTSIRQTEKLFGLRRWMSNSQFNFRTTRRQKENYEVDFTETQSLTTDYRFTLFRRYDLFLTYGRDSNFTRDLEDQILKLEGEGFNHSYQVGMKFGSWRYTPKATFRVNQAQDGSGKVTQDLSTSNYSVIMRFDKAYPQGFRVPFTKKVFGKVNRLIIDSNLTFERKKSSLNVERENTDVYSGDITGEWEISRNFRLSFGGGASLTKNRVKRDQGIMSLNVTSQLVIQF